MRSAVKALIPRKMTGITREKCGQRVPSLGRCMSLLALSVSITLRSVGKGCHFPHFLLAIPVRNVGEGCHRPSDACLCPYFRLASPTRSLSEGCHRLHFLRAIPARNVGERCCHPGECLRPH